MFVIQRTSDKHFITPISSDEPYSTELQNARIFYRRQAAEAERATGEIIIPVIVSIVEEPK